MYIRTERFYLMPILCLLLIVNRTHASNEFRPTEDPQEGMAVSHIQIDPHLLQEIDVTAAQRFFDHMPAVLGSLFDESKQTWIAGDAQKLEVVGDALQPTINYMLHTRKTILALQKLVPELDQTKKQIPPLKKRIKDLERQNDRLKTVLGISGGVLFAGLCGFFVLKYSYFNN